MKQLYIGDILDLLVQIDMIERSKFNMTYSMVITESGTLALTIEYDTSKPT